MHGRVARARSARAPRRARGRARLALRSLARRDGRDGARAGGTRAGRAARPRLHVRVPRAAGRMGGARADRPHRGDGGDRGHRRRSLVHAELEREEPETVARFRAMLAATPPEGYARCCEALGAWDARERISAIAAPALVVAGEDDPATPVAHAELIAASRIALGVLEPSARRISPTSSGRTPSPRPCSSISDRRWRRERRRDEDETRGARGRARRPGDRRHHRVHGRLPGPHHALRLGRDLVAAGPRSPHAELHHDHGARRDRPRARARDARARRAAQRGHPGRDQGGLAPVRRLLRGARGQRRVRDRPTGPGGEGGP